MMSKIFRTVSTVMILVGILFLFLYVQSQNGSKVDILNQPSYYIVQSYWFVFLSGSAVVGFSLLGSFFSWFKGFDTSEEILPNAGYASGHDIDEWIRGSTADPEAEKKFLFNNEAVDTEETELMPDISATDTSETELMPEAAETEVMSFNREGMSCAGNIFEEDDDTETLEEVKP